MLTHATLAILLTLNAAPTNWPNFRGPNHDGIALDAAIRTDWKEPPRLWERTIGDAFSSFAVVDGRVYTCGTAEREQVLLCLNAESGEVIWKKPIESGYREKMGGDGTRATPTVDQGRVYVLGALGTLLCVRADDGGEVWSNAYPQPPTWGYSGSVLIEGELALVTTSDGLIALDKATGDERWRAGDDAAGYGTPYPFVLEGKRFVAAFLARKLVIVEPTTGRVAAEIPWTTDWDVNATAPIFHDGALWIGTGYDTGSALYALKLEGDRIKTEQRWMEPKLLPKFQSPVLYQGHLYLSDQLQLKCIEWATGKEVWQVRRFEGGKAIKDSTVLLAGDQLIVLTENGELAIGPAGTSGFQPTARARIFDGLCWTVPVLVDGRLFVRDQANLVCLDLRAK